MNHEVYCVLKYLFSTINNLNFKFNKNLNLKFNKNFNFKF